MLNEGYSQQKIQQNTKSEAKEQKKAVYITLDSEDIEERTFIFEVFAFSSGYAYQVETVEIPELTSEVGNSIGLSVINHFGLGVGFGLKFVKNISSWYHSGRILVELGGTTFTFDGNPSFVLAFRNYNLGYKHRFHFLTPVNHLVPFAGASGSVILSTSSVDNLNTLSNETYEFELKLALSAEAGLSYKGFQTWFDFSYGKIGNGFGIAFYVGFRL